MVLQAVLTSAVVKFHTINACGMILGYGTFSPLRSRFLCLSASLAWCTEYTISSYCSLKDIEKTPTTLFAPGQAGSMGSSISFNSPHWST